MSHHLAILKNAYLRRILDGSKTIECRLSRTCRPPFGCVHIGDTIWFKLSGGSVLAKARVSYVEFFHPLEPEQFSDLRNRYGSSLLVDRSFLANHTEARYATFTHLRHVRPCKAYRVIKPDRHAWVVLPRPLIPDNFARCQRPLPRRTC